MRSRDRFVSTLFCALALAACSSSQKKHSARPGGGQVHWIEPSPVLQMQIDDHAARLPYLQQVEEFRDELMWFVQVGEPAYPTLLEMARDSEPKVAGTALAALAASGDARLMPEVAKIPWPEADADPRARYERARCHVKLGDWKPMGILVDGLEDPDLWNRALCFKTLRDETNQTFDYHPQMEAEERGPAVARWRAWLQQRDLDPVLGKKK